MGKDHVIVYHDGSRKWVSAKVAEMVLIKSCDKDLQATIINGEHFKFSAIAKIIPKEEFFEQYPDERPEEVRNTFQDIYGDVGNQQIRQPTQRAAELMKQGFMKYHAEQGRTPEQAEEKWKQFKSKTLESSEDLTRIEEELHLFHHKI